MKIVLVFKTSVSIEHEVKKLKPMLDELIDDYGRWNFDLEDCDNILRVETQSLTPETISLALSSKGFYCEAL